MPEAVANASNRQQILVHATRLFASQGFEGTSLQQIADAVGIRKPSLLYHFPSKEALRLAVLGDIFEHWNRTIPALLAATTSGEAEFDAVVGALIGFFRSDPDRARLILRELLDRPEEVRALLDSRVRRWLELVAARIRRGQERGTILADVDADAYVVHVIHLVLAALATHGALQVVSDDRHTHELIRIARVALFGPGGDRNEV